jgi:hypothetical protein
LAATPTTNFDTSRLRFGDMIAGGGGLVLLISLFLPWYTVDTGGIGSESGNAFEALSFIDILLLVCALVAIGVAVARMAGKLPNLPVSAGLLVLAVGVIAALLVLFRIIDLPIPDAPASIPDELEDEFAEQAEDAFGRGFGIFLSLIAAAAVAVGGWLLWKEEGQPKPGDAGSGGAGPLGAGQPGGGGYAQPPATTAAPAAAPAAQPAAPAGGGQAADWYPDPRGEKRLRYWDGSQWTDHTAD